VTPLAFLNDPTLPANAMEPTGLIFHASRCGSTLLAKVIARSQANMVFGEADPHNQIWRYIAASPSVPELLVRNIILQTGRRRLPTYQAHIVKFTSLNVLQFPTIHAAFPGVPKLFLFRTPSQILASYSPAAARQAHARGPRPSLPLGRMRSRYAAGLPAARKVYFLAVREGIGNAESHGPAAHQGSKQKQPRFFFRCVARQTQPPLTR
jgi:hypothetical protein